MDINKSYYLLSPKARDICLNCPLPECIYVPSPKVSADAICPVDGQYPPIRTLIPYSDKHKKLQKISNLLQETQKPASISFVSRETGIAQNTLLDWSRKGHLSTRLDYNGKKRRLIVGVNLETT